MMYIAQVEDGLVVRVEVSGTLTDGWISVGTENTVGIGWKYENGQFIEPIENGSES